MSQLVTWLSLGLLPLLVTQVNANVVVVVDVVVTCPSMPIIGTDFHSDGGINNIPKITVLLAN